MALMSEDSVIELSLVRGGMIPGAIILGRIVGKVPAGNSVFVDIGQERAGFLGNPPKVGAKRSEGQAVLVQVRSDAAHGKGATLGLEISFAGRWLVYTPTKPSLAVSRRLDDGEKDRLLAIFKPLLNEEEGISIRTAAAGCPDSLLVAEFAYLRGQWQQVLEARSQAKPPEILWFPDPVGGCCPFIPR
jgi:ribonuclease G